VGVVRNGPDLSAAIPEIQDVRQKITTAKGAGSAIFNAAWNEAINTENLARIAEMIAKSSLIREESRGAHYRSDFPEKDVKWLKNICIKPENGELKVWDTPVKFTRLTPPEMQGAAV
jgi:succinate dehydrogenase/fumarate reductase flavoprotein subunit